MWVKTAQRGAIPTQLPDSTQQDHSPDASDARAEEPNLYGGRVAHTSDLLVWGTASKPITSVTYAMEPQPPILAK